MAGLSFLLSPRLVLQLGAQTRRLSLPLGLLLGRHLGRLFARAV